MAQPEQAEREDRVKFPVFRILLFLEKFCRSDGLPAIHFMQINLRDLAQEPLPSLAVLIPSCPHLYQTVQTVPQPGHIWRMPI